MLIALRAILLVLFIAAPFGEHRTAADPYRLPAEFAADAVLTCPEAEGAPKAVDTWTAAEPAIARSGAAGESA